MRLKESSPVNLKLREAYTPPPEPLMKIEHVSDYLLYLELKNQQGK